jgi:hypothetical protein
MGRRRTDVKHYRPVFAHQRRSFRVRLTRQDCANGIEGHKSLRSRSLVIGIGIKPAFPVFQPLLRVGNETARVRQVRLELRDPPLEVGHARRHSRRAAGRRSGTGAFDANLSVNPPGASVPSGQR